jgi:hypothetical protein
MRTSFLALALLLPASALAHGVSMAVDQTTVEAGKVKVSFILQTGDGTEVTDQDLLITHEKLLHFQIFDEALVEFRHVHPEYSTTQKRWTVETDLPTNGNYKLFAEGTLTDEDEFTAKGKLTVQGGVAANSVPLELGDHRQGESTGAVATLSDTVFKAGRMTGAMVKISRTDGQTPVITPYLGAPAHVTGTPLKGNLLVHVHPMAESPESAELALHLTFPKAGDYRVWVEFVEGGVYRLVPLSVTVLP